MNRGAISKKLRNHLKKAGIAENTISQVVSGFLGNKVVAFKRIPKKVSSRILSSLIQPGDKIVLLVTKSMTIRTYSPEAIVAMKTNGKRQAAYLHSKRTASVGTR